jgi:hypothetical protein
VAEIGRAKKRKNQKTVQKSTLVTGRCSNAYLEPVYTSWQGVKPDLSRKGSQQSTKRKLEMFWAREGRKGNVR